MNSEWSSESKEGVVFSFNSVFVPCPHCAARAKQRKTHRRPAEHCPGTSAPRSFSDAQCFRRPAGTTSSEIQAIGLDLRWLLLVVVIQRSLPTLSRPVKILSPQLFLPVPTIPVTVSNNLEGHTDNRFGISVSRIPGLFASNDVSLPPRSACL